MVVCLGSTALPMNGLLLNFRENFGVEDVPSSHLNSSGEVLKISGKISGID